MKTKLNQTLFLDSETWEVFCINNGSAPNIATYGDRVPMCGIMFVMPKFSNTLMSINNNTLRSSTKVKAMQKFGISAVKISF